MKAIEIVMKAIAWILAIVVSVVLSPVIIPLTIFGLKKYDKFLNNLKKQNRYFTQAELEEKLKVQKGTFMVRHIGKFSELWWTSEQVVQTQPLTFVQSIHNISSEDDAFYKKHYLDENFGKAFLIKLSYWDAKQFYKGTPFIFLRR